MVPLRLLRALMAVAVLPALLLLTGGCERQPKASSTATAPAGAPAPASPAPAPAPAPATTTPPADAPAAGAAAPAGAPPRLTFASTTYDFGRLSEVDIRQASLPFTNTGGQRLVIDRVKASCGCTVVTLKKRQFEAGESGSIDIEFDPSGPGERQKKYVNVLSNASEDNVQLMILADVDPFVDMEPRFLQLGVLERGREHLASVRVSSVDKDFQVESVTATNTSMTPRVIDAGDGGKTIELTIASTAPWGALVGFLEVTVRARPGPDQEPISHMARVRVQGQVFGRLRAEPDTFRFGARPDESFERTVRIFRDDGAPFVLAGATVDAKGLIDPQVRVEQAGAGEYRIIFSATGPKFLSGYEGSVALTTDVPGEEHLAIPISGVVRLDSPGVK